MPALLQHADERVPATRRQLRGRSPHPAARDADRRRPARRQPGHARGADHLSRLVLPRPPQRRVRRTAQGGRFDQGHRDRRDAPQRHQGHVLRRRRRPDVDGGVDRHEGQRRAGARGDLDRRHTGRHRVPVLLHHARRRREGGRQGRGRGQGRRPGDPPARRDRGRRGSGWAIPTRRSMCRSRPPCVCRASPGTAARRPQRSRRRHPTGAGRRRRDRRPQAAGRHRAVPRGPAQRRRHLDLRTARRRDGRAAAGHPARPARQSGRTRRLARPGSERSPTPRPRATTSKPSPASNRATERPPFGTAVQSVPDSTAVQSAQISSRSSIG